MHSFEVHVCVLSLIQFFATPWTVVCQAPLSMGFPRQEYWNGLPFPSLVELPDSGIEPLPPALAGRFFTTEPLGKPSFKVSSPKYPVIIAVVLTYVHNSFLLLPLESGA